MLNQYTEEEIDDLLRMLNEAAREDLVRLNRGSLNNDELLQAFVSFVKEHFQNLPIQIRNANFDILHNDLANIMFDERGRRFTFEQLNNNLNQYLNSIDSVDSVLHNAGEEELYGNLTDIEPDVSEQCLKSAEIEKKRNEVIAKYQYANLLISIINNKNLSAILTSNIIDTIRERRDGKPDETYLAGEQRILSRRI
jgi:hypothetical protein